MGEVVETPRAMRNAGSSMLVAMSFGILVVLGIVLGGMLIFGTASAPPTLTSISKPFDSVDFRDLPPIEKMRSRTGGPISFRQWHSLASDPAEIVIAIHGSSASSSGFQPLAKALSAEGMWICAPDMPGHGETGRRGDIDYAGQLDDDLADLVTALRAQYSNAKFILLGFSSGGGFALHIAATPLARSFERIVLLSPMLGVNAPTTRLQVQEWASAFIPRIIAIALLNRIGIHTFDHLSVLAFAIDPNQAAYLTPSYSYLLMNAFGTADYVSDLRQAKVPLVVLVGERDELFYAALFAPTIAEINPAVTVAVVPELNHIGMITDARAVPAIVRAIGGVR
jgi:alpha-beta hydrolase superfamily lysophospholipase